MKKKESEGKTAYNKSHYGGVIRAGRQKAGLSQAELAGRLGIPRSYVGHWEAGRSRPDLNLVPELCSALGISLAAFFDAPENGDALSARERHFLEGYRRIETRDRVLLDSALDKMLALQEEALWEYCRENFRVIPHNCQSAAAGSGTMLDDDTETYQIYIRLNAKSGRADEIVTVSGASMEPVFRDGQDVYVEHTPEIEPGTIGLFVVNGNGYIKELREGVLHSLNPAYPDIELRETDDVRCMGRVLGTVEPEDYPRAEELQVLEEIRRGNGGGAQSGGAK